MPSESQILLTIEAVDNASEALAATDDSVKETAAAVDEAAVSIEESSTKIQTSLDKTALAAKTSADEQIKANEDTTISQKESSDEQELSGKKLGGIFGMLGSKAQSLGLPFSESMDKMGEGLSETEIKTKSFGSALSDLGGAALKVGAIGLASVAAVSIDLASKFQSATNQMAGSAGISIQAAQKIGTAFTNTAGTTIFSATEMMTAYSSVAGQLKTTEGHALTASQALATMTAAGNLADATGQSLSSTTTALASVMQVYGMKSNQAASASNTLYAASNALGEPISQLQTQIQRMKAQLGEAAPNLQQTGALMVDLAQHGETGRMAVRALGTGMSTLLGATPQVTGAIAELGLHIYNASGKFVGMQSVIAQLQPKLVGMGAQQRQLVETQLFGARAATMLNNTILAGSKGYSHAASSITQSNTAQIAARKMSKSLDDQIKMLKATVEDLAIKFGSFLIPKLEEVAHWVLIVVQWFIKHKVVAEALAAVIGGVLAVAIGVKLVNSIKGLVQGVMQSAEMIGKATTAMGPWGIALIAVSVIIVLIMTHMKLFKKIVGDVVEFAKAAFNDFLSGIMIVWDWIKNHWPLLLAILTGPIGLAVLLIVKNFTSIKNFFVGIVDWIKNKFLTLVDFFLHLGDDVVKSFVKGFTKIGGAIWNAIKKSISSVGGDLSTAANVIGLAEGGIVNKPTLAVVGEAGPEAVVPLKNIATQGIQSLNSSSSSAQPSVYVDMRGSMAINSSSMQELANRVGQTLTKQLSNRGAVIRA